MLSIELDVFKQNVQLTFCLFFVYFQANSWLLTAEINIELYIVDLRGRENEVYCYWQIRLSNMAVRLEQIFYLWFVLVESYLRRYISKISSSPPVLPENIYIYDILQSSLRRNIAKISSSPWGDIIYLRNPPVLQSSLKIYISKISSSPPVLSENIYS